MIDVQALKFQNVVAPTAVIDNTTWVQVGTYLDTLGIDYICYVVQFGAMDIAVAALKLTESEATGGPYTDIPLADFSVLPLTLPTAGDDNHLFGVFCPINGARMRYQKFAGTMGDGSAGTYVSCLAVMSPRDKPYSAATRGLTQQAIVAGN